MKITLRGGYSKNNTDKSFWYAYSHLIKESLGLGKRVALITLAKSDGQYDEHISNLPKGLEVIDSKTFDIEWDLFDVIFIAGGDSLNLFNNLKERGFSLEKVKDDAFILGDSAGAYILSSYFYHSPPGENRGKIIDFYKGFNPEANIITVAHKDNPVYTNEILLEKVNSFAKKHNLKIIVLAENEEKVLLI